MKDTSITPTPFSFSQNARLAPEKQGLIAIEELLRALEKNGFLPDMAGQKFDAEGKPAENIYTEGDKIHLGFRYTYTYDPDKNAYTSLEHYNVAAIPREHQGFRDMAGTVYDDVVRLYEDKPADLLDESDRQRLETLKQIRPKVLNLLLSGQSTDKLLASRNPASAQTKDVHLPAAVP